MEKRYGALQFISAFYKWCGVIGGVLVILGFIGAEIAAVRVVYELSLWGAEPTLGAYLTAIAVPLPWLIGGILSCVFLFAIGEFINLMIDVEWNTRGTYMLLRERIGRRGVRLDPAHGTWEEARHQRNAQHRLPLRARRHADEQSAPVKNFRDRERPRRLLPQGDDEDFADPNVPRPRR